jgi:hypothetical protein
LLDHGEKEFQLPQIHGLSSSIAQSAASLRISKRLNCGVDPWTALFPSRSGRSAFGGRLTFWYR